MKITRRSFISGILAGLGALAIGRIAPEEDTLDDSYIWGDAAETDDGWVTAAKWNNHISRRWQDNRIIGLYAGDGNVVIQGTMACPTIVRKFEAAQNLRTGDCVYLNSDSKLVKT